MTQQYQLVSHQASSALSGEIAQIWAQRFE